jgi:integrase
VRARFGRTIAAASRHSIENVARVIAGFWKWALAHVLEHFATTLLPAITVERVDAYKTAKVRERELLEEELRRWQKADPKTRGQRPPRPLSNTSINRTLRVLAQVLDDAIEYGHINVNPARGRKRRLKASRPRRIWLELDEVRSPLDAAGRHRALIATLILAGLRVSELCELRWRAVDLARGKLTVEESKTDAGTGRKVELTPMLLDELNSIARQRAKPAPMISSSRRLPATGVTARTSAHGSCCRC